MIECIYCKKQFEAYITNDECEFCDDGTVEVEVEFGEGSYFKDCGSCGGTGMVKHNEKRFCCEDCRVEYLFDQCEAIS